MSITIRLFKTEDIEIITSSLAAINWDNRTSTLKRYLTEQDKGERTVLVAYSDRNFAGYVTIMWKSNYPPFAEQEIPEINDLIVLPVFRRHGIASALMNEAENRISERTRVAGIGVGMFQDYGAAQRMYILRGYVPDTLGLFYKGQHVKLGQEVHVDDELILYLTKEI
ncbi:MAG TPA: GNAT family N-acetyltransferase [Dehalococcoidia bacterium]|nr:GNAT family N-acetyltransferase [Dehalococcoidia bacterium]